TEIHDLPPGCRPLAELVEAPPALCRRLAQVGVVDAAAADRLQGQLRQGQRLVSPDGGLWRWDGFVRRSDASRSAAARLRQRTRLRRLQRDAAAAQERLAAAEQELAAARRELDHARAAQRAAESACEQARRELELARSAVLEVRADDAALAAEISALTQERATLVTEQGELDHAAAALLAQLDDLAGAAPAEDFALLREIGRASWRERVAARGGA